MGHYQPPKKRSSTRDLDDGIIQGRLHDRLIVCDVCRTKQQGIWIHNVELPIVGNKRLTPVITMILFRESPMITSEGKIKVIPITYIGIGCGCYGRAHRQLAHIAAKRKYRRKK